MDKSKIQNYVLNLNSAMKTFIEKSLEGNSKISTMQEPLKSALSDTMVRLTFRNSLESPGGNVFQKYERKIDSMNVPIQFSFTPQNEGKLHRDCQNPLLFCFYPKHDLISFY